MAVLMNSKLYRKFTHDILNLTGRLQSVASLLDPNDPPSREDLAMTRRLIEQDSHKLNAALRLFCLTHWLQAEPDMQQDELDLSLLLQEVVAPHLSHPETPVVLGMPEQPLRLTSARDILQPLLEELLHNAVAHSAASTAVDINTDQDGDTITIEFSNTPLAPLPENHTESLTTRPESPGMGLGLVFAHKAASHLNGNLSFHEEGGFVKVRLTL